ncbi:MULTISPECIES: hypothetical protein [Clostridium]|uniref:hypothetical protein n=1 Tax=Clostridium TaxID=1485 RepID=UPI00082560EA|nr:MULTISPECIES: hypothetical protein [Clostridium]PJI08233.1 hypothetical protein CUB90_10305 [Clostridium sp. CT7]
MKLSIQEGYLTMFWFIDSFYWESKDDDLGALLGDLSPVTFIDCISVDPAAWEMWSDTINKFNFQNSKNKYIKNEELPTIIELFLTEYVGNCYEIDIIYKNIRILKGNDADSELSKRWYNAIESGKENPNNHFYGLKYYLIRNLLIKRHNYYKN